MTETELDHLRALYDPEMLRVARIFDGRELPEGYSLPPASFWHYKAQGQEFIVVACGKDDFRAFVPVDREGLAERIGPAPTAHPRTL
jgi:hypothetical protein